MEREALTTPATPASTRPSAERRSRSSWSITAISPGWIRRSRFFVLRSTRAVPAAGRARRERSRSRFRGLVAAVETPPFGSVRRRPAGSACAGALRRPSRTSVADRPRSAADGASADGGRLRQELLRVGGGDLAVGEAGEHAGDLGHPFAVVQHLDRGRRTGLLDPEVAVGEARDLREGRE